VTAEHTCGDVRERRARLFSPAEVLDLIGVITDGSAYARFDEEYWDRLRDMSAAESIALGEALLASELRKVAVFPDDDHPMSLAKSLGIRPRRT
jgi:hypothetical protein